MYPGLVQERVAPDDRLVRRHVVAGHVRDHARGVGELARLDPHLDAVVVASRYERHHDLLERGVPGPLSYAVDGDLDLRRPSLYAGKGVGHGEPEVVVAVHGEGDPSEVRYPLLQLAQEGRELGRRRVADGVGDVDDVGPGLDSRGHHLGKVPDVRTGGVHRRELHVLAEALRETHCLSSPLQYVLAVRAHLVLDVQIRGSDEGVDARPRGPLHSLPGALYVLLVDAGEPRYGGTLDLGGDAAHGLEVALRGDGEARLDHIHLEPGELVGDLELLLYGERDPRRLLAVSQGCVEDLYSTHLSHPPTFEISLGVPLERRWPAGSPARTRGR